MEEESSGDDEEMADDEEGEEGEEGEREEGFIKVNGKSSDDEEEGDGDDDDEQGGEDDDEDTSNHKRKRATNASDDGDFSEVDDDEGIYPSLKKNLSPITSLLSFSFFLFLLLVSVCLFSPSLSQLIFLYRIKFEVTTLKSIPVCWM